MHLQVWGAPLVGAPYSMKEEENTMLEAKIMYLLESAATEINYRMMRLDKSAKG